jgi:2-iminobutanoate/2-iminopropanoate deaminase
MNFVQSDNVPKAIGPYSQAVQVGDMVFTSGQIALKPNGEFLNEDVEAQTEQVLTNLKNLLEAGGSSLQKVVKTTMFLVNMDDFAKVNTIYAKYFGEHKPARSTIGIKVLPRNALVEIEAIAKL